MTYPLNCCCQQYPALTKQREASEDNVSHGQTSDHTTINNNGSITEISLSPVKLNTSPMDDMPAVMNVDSAVDMDNAAVLTSENLNSNVVITTQSSVMDMETEQTENSAVCGQALNSCAIL